MVFKHLTDTLAKTSEKKITFVKILCNNSVPKKSHNKKKYKKKVRTEFNRKIRTN